MYPIRLALLLALLLAWSVTVAQAQETTVTYTVEGRTFTCTTTAAGGQQTSQCHEVNGPYQSTCVGAVGSASETCTDNYGNTWDPSKNSAPALPPASQPPTGSAPAPPAAAPPPAAGPCAFELGFAALHGLIPTIVGGCVTNEYHNPANGDGLQQTANGLLVWRKADNWTAFTNGSMTWINGPQGL